MEDMETGDPLIIFVGALTTLLYPLPFQVVPSPFGLLKQRVLK